MPSQVSSSSTLFLKIFFPVFWIVFFGAFTMAVLYGGETNFGDYSVENMQFYLPIFLIGGILLMYFTLIQLKRVEMDDLYVYATNYFKTYRYPYHNIEKIAENNYGLFKTCKVHFKEKGHFGKKITFLLSKRKFDRFIEKYPEVVEKLKR